MLGWVLDDAATHRRASGAIRSSLELSLAETEYGPRPGLALIVQRAGEQHQLKVAPRQWSGEARPHFNAADRAYHRRALAIRSRIDPQGITQARSTASVGNVFWRRGELADAQEHFAQTLAILERIEPDGWLTG